MPAIRKPIAEITRNDLDEVVRDQWLEDELLEFKKTLSAKNGDPDKWIVDQSQIGDSAKRHVLAEVVAMANSYGGDVILGIDETQEKPPRASAITPLPKCVDLAHRLEMSARDLIKPEIPMLTMRGIPTDGESGLVIIRAPRSRLAPHRLEMKGIEKECYKRVSDRTEPMTMREIQDLTFGVVKGLQAVDARLLDLHSEFTAWAKIDKTMVMSRRLAFRVSATPASADLYMEHVHDDERVRPISLRQKIALGAREFDCSPVATPDSWRPVLRGTQSQELRATDRQRVIRLSCDGTFHDMTLFSYRVVDQQSERTDYCLYPGWYFCAIICGMHSIERFRKIAGGQSVQYALEVEIAASEELPVLKLDTTSYYTAGSIPAGMHAFPRYQLGEPDSWPETFNLIWRDFWNFIGVDAKGDEVRLVG